MYRKTLVPNDRSNHAGAGRAPVLSPPQAVLTLVALLIAISAALTRLCLMFLSRE
jgi:hypothetical protein